MASPITNPLTHLSSKHLLAQCSNPHHLAMLVSSSSPRYSMYLGIDPTAASLHVGHLVGISALLALKPWFKPIALVGGATALIGDPSGRADERRLLTRQEVQGNAESISQQLSHLLGDCTIINNASWYDHEMSALSLLRDVGKHFRVHTMLSRDSVRLRQPDYNATVDSGLTFTELAYQILQAHDFTRLYQTHDCRLQIGGTDQWGNMVGGIDLIKRTVPADEVNNSPPVGITIPLVTVKSNSPDRARVKVGKSAGNAIWLDRSLTSDFSFYQYFMGLDDEDATTMFHMLAGSESLAIPTSSPPQRALAHAVTLQVRGQEAVTRAQYLSSLFFSPVTTMPDSPQTCRDVVQAARESGMPITCMSSSSSPGLDVITAAVQLQLCSSKGEAKRHIDGGGLYLNGVRVSDPHTPVNLLYSQCAIVRVGKSKIGIIVP